MLRLTRQYTICILSCWGSIVVFYWKFLFQQVSLNRHFTIYEGLYGFLVSVLWGIWWNFTALSMLVAASRFAHHVLWSIGRTSLQNKFTLVSLALHIWPKLWSERYVESALVSIVSTQCLKYVWLIVVVLLLNFTCCITSWHITTRYLAHAVWYRNKSYVLCRACVQQAQDSTTQHVTTSAASATPRAQQARYTTL